MTIEDQVDQLQLCVKQFADAVIALDESLFLTEVTGWTVRDMVAHLVGWNRHIVRGSQQILRGALPFYDVDPGPDYSNVNAALVREYDEVDRAVLLESLAASTGELAEFLRTLDPGDWDRDCGVQHDGETLTVKGTVNDLIADYDHHRVQLEDFGASPIER
jgi:hypothetical protein